MAMDGRMARPMTPDELGALGRALLSSGAAIELAALLGCLLVAGLLSWLLRGRTPEGLHSRSVLFGKRVIDGALFPLLAFALAWLARWLLQGEVPAVLLRIAIPLLFALAAIRLVVRVLGAAFPQSQAVRIVERWVSWAVWLALILWLTGVLPVLLDELEGITWKVGSTKLSLLALLEGAFNAVVVLVMALWVSAAIETRLLKNRHDNLSVRKMAANATRAALLFFGLLMALSAAGIDLTALSVLGGAVGVGLGFGLQKLASNYVSGFVILAERSLRSGDLVKVDGFEGRITDINTRATIIRAASGRESIVPNELLITQRVENASLAQTATQLATVFPVPRHADLGRLRPLLLKALEETGRTMTGPGRAVAIHLSSITVDHLELTASYWVEDPLDDPAGVRSDVNLAVLGVLEAEGLRTGPVPGASSTAQDLPP